MRTAEIATALIDPPENPHRLDFDPAAMLELERSITHEGLINAINVKPNGERFRIIAGHRRWTAHVNLKLATIRCTIEDDIHDTRSELVQIAENFNRSNLSPMEEAIVITNLAEKFNNDVPGIMRAIHRGRGFVESRLALVGIPPDLKELVHTKRLGITAALHLAKIENEEHRDYHTQHAVNSGAAEPVVRSWVESYLVGRLNDPAAPPVIPPTIEPGQPVVILMPCFLCGTPHPYQTLRIQRVCGGCTEQIEKAERTTAAPLAAVAG